MCLAPWSWSGAGKTVAEQSQTPHLCTPERDSRPAPPHALTPAWPWAHGRTDAAEHVSRAQPRRLRACREPMRMAVWQWHTKGCPARLGSSWNATRAINSLPAARGRGCLGTRRCRADPSATLPAGAPNTKPWADAALHRLLPPCALPPHFLPGPSKPSHPPRMHQLAQRRARDRRGRTPLPGARQLRHLGRSRTTSVLGSYYHGSSGTQ
jgi:hypothetical protein